MQRTRKPLYYVGSISDNDVRQKRKKKSREKARLPQEKALLLHARRESQEQFCYSASNILKKDEFFLAGCSSFHHCLGAEDEGLESEQVRVSCKSGCGLKWNNMEPSMGIVGNSRMDLPLESEQSWSKPYSLSSPFIECQDRSPSNLSSVKIEIDNPEILPLTGKGEKLNFWQDESCLQYAEVKIETGESEVVNDSNVGEVEFRKSSLNESIDVNRVPMMMMMMRPSLIKTESHSMRRIDQGSAVRQLGYTSNSLSRESPSSFGDRDQRMAPRELEGLPVEWRVTHSNSVESCEIDSVRTMPDGGCSSVVDEKNILFDDNDIRKEKVEEPSFFLPKGAVKPFGCKVCGQLFLSFANLMTHCVDGHNICKVYVCTLCCQDFDTESDHQSHQETHIEYQYMMDFNTCPICCVAFVERSHMDRHIICHTAAVKLSDDRDDSNPARGRRTSFQNNQTMPETCHSCPVCKDLYDFSEDLMLHLNNHDKPHKCPFCSEAYFYSGLLHFHMKEHIDKYLSLSHPEYRFTLNSQKENCNLSNSQDLNCLKCKKSKGCCSCKKKKRTAQAKKKRNWRQSQSETQCNVCGKFYSTTSSLAIHMRIHNGEKPFKCNDCGKAFSQKHILQSHVRTHRGEKPFRCNICGDKAYSQKISLKLHMKKHDETGLRLKKDYQPTLDKIVSIVKKDVTLDASFNDNNDNSNNNENDNKDENNNIIDNKKEMINPFWCSQCDKTFKSLPGLKLHIHSHGRKKKVFECEVCGKISTTKGNLSVHMRIHTGEKPFKCLLCGKAYGQSHLLKYHSLRCHNVKITV